MTRQRVIGPLAAVTAICLSAAAAPAQTGGVLRGHVVGPEGEPVAGATVALHRVSASAGGAEVGRATTTADGRFEVAIPASTAADGVFFAATRFDGKLYVGAPFRETDAAPDDYVIVIGVGAVGAAGPASPTGSAPAPLPWPIGLLIAAAALWVVAHPLLPGGRRYADRSLLLALAELEERSAAAAPERREDDRAERAALRARLRTITGTVAAHAADQH